MGHLSITESEEALFLTYYDISLKLWLTNWITDVYLQKKLQKGNLFPFDKETYYEQQEDVRNIHPKMIPNFCQKCANFISWGTEIIETMEVSIHYLFVPGCFL